MESAGTCRWKPACQQRDTPPEGERCTWRWPNPIAHQVGASMTSAMRSGWSGDWWPRNWREFRNKCRTALVADRDTPETATDAGPPRLQNQLEAFWKRPVIAIELSFGSVGCQRAAHAEGLGGGRKDPAALAALADRRLRATPAQLCDAPRLHGTKRRLPPTAEDVTPGVTTDRRADGPTGSGDLGPAPTTSGRGAADCGGAGLGVNRRIRSSPKSSPAVATFLFR